jgi:hypothetical protein
LVVAAVTVSVSVTSTVEVAPLVIVSVKATVVSTDECVSVTVKERPTSVGTVTVAVKVLSHEVSV